MTVIATVGLPGCGKGEAAAVASDLGLPVITMGDVIREETRRRGLDPKKDHGAVALALRDEEGPKAVAKRSLSIVEGYLENEEAVFVDGIRSDAEVSLFEEEFGNAFVLICIDAPFELRSRRITDRGRDHSAADGGETLRNRDEREIGFGMDRAMERADVVVENIGTLAEFRRDIRKVISETINES